MNILLKSATIINSATPTIHLKKRDIHIKNGIIEKIAQKIDKPAGCKELRLENLHVSIGWFDSSVSFGEPGFEERETLTNGLATAAKSGFTDIVLNTNTEPAPDSGSEISFFKEKSKGVACNLYPMGCLTMERSGERLAELFDMHQAKAVAFSDYKRSIANGNLLKIALQYGQNFDGLVLSFPQDTQVVGKGVMNEGEVSVNLGLKGIPNLAEELQLARDIYLLEYAGGKLHVPTISTANAVKLIAEAKKKGLDISCSVSIHHLFFTDEMLKEFDSNYKVTPPLRAKHDVKALLKGLQNGIIDFVTTDHKPVAIEDKRLEFDNAASGTIGLESAFGALNQIMPAEDSISLLTKGRERFGIAVPELKEGKDACLTLFNPEGEYQFSEEHIYSSSKNSAFLGSTLKGRAYGIINNDMVEIW